MNKRFEHRQGRPIVVQLGGVTVTRAGANLGAEISGVDLRKPRGLAPDQKPFGRQVAAKPQSGLQGHLGIPVGELEARFQDQPFSISRDLIRLAPGGLQNVVQNENATLDRPRTVGL